MARDDRSYDDEYEDDEEYEDEYEDDEYEEEDEDYPRRNPLKPFVIALIILMLLMAVIIGLLFMRLQTANDRVTELNNSLTATRTELNNLLLEKTSATPVPTPSPEPTPEPTATPEPTPEPTATPEPTPEPTPTPEPLLKNTVTDEDLAGVIRPADDKWFDHAKKGYVDAAYMLALHWGPNMAWNENMALLRDTPVEMLASQNGWTLVRTAEGKYGWGAGNLFREAPADEAATAAPAEKQG